jgi:hypothetical protein
LRIGKKKKEKKKNHSLSTKNLSNSTKKSHLPLAAEEQEVAIYVLIVSPSFYSLMERKYQSTVTGDYSGQPAVRHFPAAHASELSV